MASRYHDAPSQSRHCSDQRPPRDLHFSSFYSQNEHETLLFSHMKSAPGIPSRTLPRVRAFFITFATYGARLHGDTAGSVDREHNVYGTNLCTPNLSRVTFERRRMNQPAYTLDEPRRAIVLGACREVCECRAWWLFAAHVRSNHVHIIVQAGDKPEEVLNTLKAYSSRALTQAKFEPSERKRWARHGSTRYLWNDERLRSAIRYVLQQQGDPMAVYAAPNVWHPTEPRP